MTRRGKLNSKPNAGKEKSHAAVSVHLAQGVAAEARPAHSATNRHRERDVPQSCAAPGHRPSKPKASKAKKSLILFLIGAKLGPQIVVTGPLSRGWGSHLSERWRWTRILVPAQRHVKGAYRGRGGGNVPPWAKVGRKPGDHGPPDWHGDDPC